MKRTLDLFMTLLVFISFIGCATKSKDIDIDQQYIKNNLAKFYEGTFRWKGNETTQDVSIKITDIQIDNNYVTAWGEGKYNTDVVTKVDVKIKIDAESLHFEMWESNPDRDEGFITNGSHVGSISKDLYKIHAVWTTKDSERQGILNLEAN